MALFTIGLNFSVQQRKDQVGKKRTCRRALRQFSLPSAKLCEEVAELVIIMISKWVLRVIVRQMDTKAGKPTQRIINRIKQLANGYSVKKSFYIQLNQQWMT